MSTEFPMGKQERAARLSLIGLMLIAGYYGYALYHQGTWDLMEAAGRAGEHLIRNAILLGLVLEVLHWQLTRKTQASEALEDERDQAIRAAGTRSAFRVTVAGLFVLSWQLYFELRLPEQHHLPEGLMAHLPLAILFLAYSAKYLTEIWLYLRDRT